MKNKFTLLSLLAGLFLVSASASSQVLPKLDETFAFYKKLNYVASSANETTGYAQFAPANNIVILGTATDSAKVILNYQLKDGVTGLTGSWTLADTLDLGGSGGQQLIVNLPIATVGGYDQIRYYVDYLTGTTLVTGATVRFYRRLLK